jgi:hypothetical protein
MTTRIPQSRKAGVIPDNAIVLRQIKAMRDKTIHSDAIDYLTQQDNVS